MKYHAIRFGAVSLTVSLAAHAQTPNLGTALAAPRPQTPAQTTQRPDAEIDDDVKVVGCLRLWDASIGALPGHATGPRYVLINAKQDDNPGRDVVVLRRYLVVGDPSVNLA